MQSDLPATLKPPHPEAIVKSATILILSLIKPTNNSSNPSIPNAYIKR